MKLGLLARADSRGLGVQVKGVFDNLAPPERVMVVDCPSMKPLPIRRDWYPDATWIRGLPTNEDCKRFADGLTAIYSAETFYNSNLPSIAREFGARTVLHTNYEFLNPHDQPSLWASPSMWHYDDIPDPKCLLPVPVELERFDGLGSAMFGVDHDELRVLHPIGRPALIPAGNAMVERSGTRDLLAALRHITSRVTLTLRCQEPGYIDSLLIAGVVVPPNVTLVVNSGDLPNYWDAYTGQDLLVLPRRWGGLSLPTNEALAAGMPTVMPDCSPNNTWLPTDWLVPAIRAGEFRAKQRFDFHRTDPQALAGKIDEFASDAAHYRDASACALGIGKQLSWENLRPEYERALA